MNREIKFRAWLRSYDDSEGEMKYLPIHIQRFDFEDGWVMSFTDNSDFAYHERYENRVPHEFKIMQYTGLKDRRGTEIYEGDLMTHPEFAAGDIIEVRFHQGCFCLEFWDSARTNFTLGEVVGNIYENPELLTPKP